MFVSLNELNAVCQKAALGAGAGIGAAEDAGNAVAWWVVRQRPIVFRLLRALERLDREDAVYGEADIDQGPMIWRGSNEKPVSSVMVGGAPVDLISATVQGELVIECMDAPLLLIPHLASSAEISIGLECVADAKPISIAKHKDEVRVYGDIQRIEQLEDCQVKLSKPFHTPRGVAAVTWLGSDASDLNSAMPETGFQVDDEQWAALYKFARRMLVKATEQSRTLGAGAGLSDND